jgi:CubicO group peptidase (beta-lactamase class C family)
MGATMIATERQAGRCASTDAPEEVSSAVIEMMRKAGAPGVSLVVVDGDSVICSESYGLADIERSCHARASTSFLWFSMSKLVTATAALRLADEGRLDLTAPVDECVPHLRAPRAVQPTMQQLLSHTAGLINPLPVRWVHDAGSPPPTAEALLRRIMARRAYRRSVGRSARYSNVGYLAAGEVMAAATGEPFDRLVRRLVLEPVGMHHTDFAHPTGTDLATGHVALPPAAAPVLRALLPGDLVGSRHGSLVAMKPFYVDGPAYGGLVGTALDAGRFLRMHLNDGELDGVHVLRPDTARRMRTIAYRGKPFDHGLGWFRKPASSPERWVEHFGSGVGYWNVMRLYPDRGLGVVMMSNGTRALDFEPVMTQLLKSF